MSENAFTLPDMTPVTMTGLAAARLIEGGNGDAALLYIYILKNNGDFSLPNAQSALRFDERRVSAAASALAGMGLLSREAPKRTETLRPSDELPQYDVNEIKTAATEDGRFSALISEVQRSLGHILSSADLTKLFGIYDHLGLPSEVILTLVTHCADDYRRRYGEGRTPTMRFIEAAAFKWEREGIVTLPEAEEYVRTSEELNDRLTGLRRVLGIRDRQLSRSEREYLERWAAMGHSTDAVSLAYDRTVSRTGRLAWKYMDRILTDWHEKGLHTAAEAEKGDSRSAKTPTGKKEPSSGRPDAEELARMKRALEEIKNG